MSWVQRYNGGRLSIIQEIGLVRWLLPWWVLSIWCWLDPVSGWAGPTPDELRLV